MKVLIVLSVVVAIVLAEWKLRSNEDFQLSKNKCIRDLKVPQEFVDKINKVELLDSDIMRQHNKCFWVDIGMWDDKGLVIDNWKEQMKGKISEDELRTLMYDCNRNDQKSDDLGWSFRAFQCIMGTKLGPIYKEMVSAKN